MLPNKIISLDLEVDLRPNMYKFYVAYYINELICRNKKNIMKRYTIGETWEHYAAIKRKEREDRNRLMKKKQTNDVSMVDKNSDDEAIEQENEH